MRILVKNIKELVTVDDGHKKKISGEAMAHPVIMQNAYLYNPKASTRIKKYPAKILILSIMIKSLVKLLWKYKTTS